MAWRNHPPVDATPATVLAAVANLDRVRGLKRAAREAAIAARHERVLAQARRHAELVAVAASTPGPEGQAGSPSAASGHSADPALSPATVAPLRTGAATVTGNRAAASDTREDFAGADVKVPATAATLTQWATTWVRMCGDGDLALGPLNDDEQARTRYQLSAKQLRNIRNAATSGALRRRADELGVRLPAGYVDHPASGRVNGHRLTTVPG